MPSCLWDLNSPTRDCAQASAVTAPSPTGTARAPLVSAAAAAFFLTWKFKNINYSLCRLTIGSCDFALSTYAYAKKHDLSDFSIEKDKRYIIPFIKEALKVNPNLKFLASPWSPPSFMKNTKIPILGGKLLNKYKQTKMKTL